MKQETEKSTWEILKIDPYLQPFADAIEQRMAHYAQTKKRLLSSGQTLRTFASGSLYYGFHRTADGWVYREWAPHATALHLIGDFNGWNRTSHPLKAVGDGNWEIVLSGADSLPHESRVRCRSGTAALTDRSGRRPRRTGGGISARTARRPRRC